VQKIIPLTEHYSENDLLQYAAAVQQNSEHHIAKGIMQTLSEKNWSYGSQTISAAMQGIGVTGIVNSKSVVAAGPNYFVQNNKQVPAIPEEINQDAETVNFILIDDVPVGIVSLADTIREGAKEAIDQLRKHEH
jgi:Cu2+-exporting ATPase